LIRIQINGFDSGYKPADEQVDEAQGTEEILQQQTEEVAKDYPT
jgi:hypothetical protein